MRPSLGAPLNATVCAAGLPATTYGTATNGTAIVAAGNHGRPAAGASSRAGCTAQI